MKNLLIEGPRGVGKTTLLIETLGAQLKNAKGFVTVRLVDCEGKRLGFAVEKVTEGVKPDKVFDGDMSNVFISYANSGQSGENGQSGANPVIDIGRFIETAGQVLDDSQTLPDDSTEGFILLDEFGGVELADEAFTSKLLTALAGSRPVIGVIKSRENMLHALRGLSAGEGLVSRYDEFRKSIADMNNTEIITLTDNNREEVKLTIRKWEAENAAVSDNENVRNDNTLNGGNMWEIYDSLIDEIPGSITVTGVVEGEVWTAVRTSRDTVGIAMTTDRECTGRIIADESYVGRTLREVAGLVKSWNLREASIGMAAVNAYYNTKDRLDRLDLRQKQEGHSTFGMDVAGKNIVMIGALKSRKVLEAQGAKVTVLEREDKPDTLPDSAAEYVVPGCDILVITASAFINKTLPRLLELGRGSVVVVAGPSAPMAPQLVGHGIDRVAGMAVTKCAQMFDFAASGRAGQPYDMGERFCIDNVCPDMNMQ